MEATMNAGSQIITTLENAWRAIQARHPEIPDAVVITGTGNERGNERWGHHWASRWRLADRPGRVDELFVAGELLALGGRRIMQTLLHESAHALADVRNIKDTSRNGHYHNRRFVALAGEVGLDPPAASNPRGGLSGVTLGDATAASYAEVIAALDAAALAYLEDPTSVAATGGDDGGDDGEGEQGGTGRGGRGRNGKRLAVTCQCDRRLHVTPKQYEEAPINCGRCNMPFQADPDDLDALAVGA